jgi:hypothetical protein
VDQIDTIDLTARQELSPETGRKEFCNLKLALPLFIFDLILSSRSSTSRPRPFITSRSLGLLIPVDHGSPFPPTALACAGSSDASRILSESDETSGELSIEAYIYRSDPYRSTTISNPCPYPLKDMPASQPIRDKVMSHMDAIWAILTEHGFLVMVALFLCMISPSAATQVENLLLLF